MQTPQICRTSSIPRNSLGSWALPRRARHGAVAAASKCSSRGSGASAKPQKRARPDFQAGETSEHRQFLTTTDQRVTDEAAAAVGALAATCVTRPAVAPGTRGWQELLARSTLSSARPRLLGAPTCAGSIFPLLAPGPRPKGRLQDQPRSYGKLVVALVSPICCSAAQQESSGREQDGGCVWAHFWLFKRAQASPFCGLITNNSVPCLPLGTQNWL